MKEKMTKVALLLLGLILLVWLYQMGYYQLASIWMISLSLGLGLISFNQYQHSVRELMIIVVMTSIAVVGRVSFFFIPSVSPMIPIVMITGIYFGRKEGYIVGMLAAFMSNFFFTQGPWTPFQMFTTSLIGYISGAPLWKETLKKSNIGTIILAVVSGIMYSLLMDIWTVLSIDGYFNLKRYFIVLVPAIPYMVTYSMSNVIFMLVLKAPFGEKIKELQHKYKLH